MSQLIKASVGNSITSGHSSPESTVQEEVSYYSAILPTVTSSQLENSPTAYQIKLPLFLDPVRIAFEKISSFKNPSIKLKVSQILGLIRNNLAHNLDIFRSSIRLPQIHVTESDDDSALIEWNFQSFRIGFSLDAADNSASYFVISEDRQSDSFLAETKRMDGSYQEVVSAIVDYVIFNS